MVLLLFLTKTAPLLSWAQGSAFTYQGRLSDAGKLANGAYDFRFRLTSDAQANNYVGTPVLTNGLAVSDGLFTVILDFGSVFNGSNYWLEVDVRTNGASGYSVLAPLQVDARALRAVCDDARRSGRSARANRADWATGAQGAQLARSLEQRIKLSC